MVSEVSQVSSTWSSLKQIAAYSIGFDNAALAVYVTKRSGKWEVWKFMELDLVVIRTAN